MKHVIGLAAALFVGTAAMGAPALAQGGAPGSNTTQMTGSNATGVKPEGGMSKMSGSGGQMKSKKMKMKKNRM